MKSRRSIICLWHTGGALCIGALFYLFFRKETYLHTFLQTYFQYAPPFIPVRNPILTVLCNHIGDFLWAYALSSALYWIFPKNRYAAVSAFVGASVLGTGLELLQKSEIFSGTFDWLDILAEIIAAGLAVILIQRSLKK